MPPDRALLQSYSACLPEEGNPYVTGSARISRAFAPSLRGALEGRAPREAPMHYVMRYPRISIT
jgi:hypothetical protein